MIKRSFFGFSQPRLEYSIVDLKAPGPRTVKPSGSVQIFIDSKMDTSRSILLKAGDAVKSGQKLTLMSGSNACALAPVTGTIKAVEPQVGNFGRICTAIRIAPDAAEAWDEALTELLQTPGKEAANAILGSLPGGASPGLLDTGEEFHTLVINGMDDDLLVHTRQYAVASNVPAIREGVKLLKQLTGVDNIYISVPERLHQDAVSTGAKPILIPTTYPSASPKLVVHRIAGKAVPAGKTCEEEGYGFITAETVAALAKAFETKRLPMNKLLTVVSKSGESELVSALIGTPLKDIFKTLNLSVNEKDRVIAGGPMTGVALYSLEQPVEPEMDAIMLQDQEDIPWVSDTYCINCGECVRICPVRIPVNMMVRFLEAKQYEDAMDTYDLDACIDCGLCSYVCPARIPIFQYIRLAKCELARSEAVEADNV